MKKNNTASKKAAILLSLVVTAMLAGAALAGDGYWSQNPVTGDWTKTTSSGMTIKCDSGVNTCSIVSK